MCHGDLWDSVFQWRFSYFSELQVLKWLLQLCFGLLACCRASLLIAVSFSVYTGCLNSYFSELLVLKWLLQLCFGLLACCRAFLLIAVSFSVLV